MPELPDPLSPDRRSFLMGAAWAVGAAFAPRLALEAMGQTTKPPAPCSEPSAEGACCNDSKCFPTRDKVPDPENLSFWVRYPGKDPVRLEGHYWYNADAAKEGRKFPALVELNPYRRRDGMMLGDSAFYPYFAYHEYLCFRVDLQGSGDSGGILTDEYTEEEVLYCIQVIEQVARHPLCNGKVGMMGKSWSAINSLMVAAHDRCPSELKAVLVICGSDDRYNDDVHYMGGAMMQDNVGWPSSMWGWIAQPPDPEIVGNRWKQMWRERIRNADFWFKHWGSHQTRDSYWSSSSVRDRYDRVKVPVYIVSGYLDGYKNPVVRAVEGLHSAGMAVQGLLGPWGHAKPHAGDPGPRINWLPYLLHHWWDRWLKDADPNPREELPELTVWLGESREPSRSCCTPDRGKWASEDAQWPTRVREKVFYLWPNQSLSPKEPGHPGYLICPGPLVLGTKMLETSSWGQCGNDDLPGDQTEADNQSLHFDSGPLAEDMDCFGYPTVSLNLVCNKPLASVAVRLCEISPYTGASHLVTYSFFNLCYRDGDMAAPRPVSPGVPFHVSFPLNVFGHTFKRGWRVRLSLSPSLFPTLWQSTENPILMVVTGRSPDSPASALSLPGRRPRAQDRRLKKLLPSDPQILCVDSSEYVPTVESRKSRYLCKVKPITRGKKKGVLVRKVTDSGRYCYGGPLRDLWVDQVSQENFRIFHDDPLSMTGLTASRTSMKRAGEGGEWKIKLKTATRVWTEKDSSGKYFFRYTATIKTFIANARGEFEPFEHKTVKGSIPRLWV
ncbi:MAG TPA: CocE/NonD family hydrolase [Syntrophobacteraceae bacterium]|nr:CocE/NonD family hydrolase [Syntrophobacteraceae bacterium]